MRTHILAIALVALLVSGAAAADRPKIDFADIVKAGSEALTDLISHLPKTTGKFEGRKLRALGLESVQQFFTDVLGGNWTDHLPASWSLPSFNWDKLGTFEYTNNLQDFVQNVNLTKPASLAELHETLAEAESAFCTEEKFVPSVKVPASCTGASVTLAFVPKVCVLDADNKAVVCDPAKLVLVKSPGACTHSYHSASAWKGKECKIGGTVGFARAVVKGGGDYSIPLKTISIDYTP